MARQAKDHKKISANHTAGKDLYLQYKIDETQNEEKSDGQDTFYSGGCTDGKR